MPSRLLGPGTTVRTLLLQEFEEGLASLDVGEAWFWLPRADIFERLAVETVETFDSSATQLPGPEQRRLERFAGSYIATVRTWASPDVQPKATTLISEQSMIMGGCFLQVDDRSEDGSYHWRAVHGWDDPTMYASTWGSRAPQARPGS